MLGALLLLLVILNAALSGWLLAQVKTMKRTVAGLADVVATVEHEHDHLRMMCEGE